MIRFLVIISFLFFISCGKSFIETDPITGEAPRSVSSNSNAECKIISFKQINGALEYNKYSITRDTSLLTTKIEVVDNYGALTNNIITLRYNIDTIILGNHSWMRIDKSTGNVLIHYLREFNSDSSSFDEKIVSFKYDINDHLVKKTIYYNGSTIPSYTTDYLYNKDNLVSCQMYLGSGGTKILQSDITYDLSKEIKPWIYSIADSFDDYMYLPAFKFGKKPTNPISAIVTKIYDFNDASLIDTWTTNFSGYVFSKDDYVVQVTTNGDYQQGLGLFLGMVRFEYKCK